jgi:hypothetical protein
MSATREDGWFPWPEVKPPPGELVLLVYLWQVRLGGWDPDDEEWWIEGNSVFVEDHRVKFWRPLPAVPGGEV